MKKNLSFCGFVDAWRMLQGYVGVPLATSEHFHIAFQAACVVVFLTAVANHGEGKHHANVHHLLPFGLQGLPGSASTIFQPLPSDPSSKTKSSGLHRHQLGSIEIGRVENASCESPSFHFFCSASDGDSWVAWRLETRCFNEPFCPWRYRKGFMVRKARRSLWMFCFE